MRHGFTQSALEPLGTLNEDVLKYMQRPNQMSRGRNPEARDLWREPIRDLTDVYRLDRGTDALQPSDV